MGADLYIESRISQAKDVWQPFFNRAVESRDSATSKEEKAFFQEAIDEAYNNLFPSNAYFRDSYNPSSLLDKLGLSWWADVIPMLEEGYLPIERAKEFLMILENITLNEEKVLEAALDFQKSFEEMIKYFHEKKENLMNLLRESIELNEPIYCSL